MDIATGKTYESLQAALADGVPASDVARVTKKVGEEPIVRFKNGPFKDRAYKRNELGQLVRVG